MARRTKQSSRRVSKQEVTKITDRTISKTEKRPTESLPVESLLSGEPVVEKVAPVESDSDAVMINTTTCNVPATAVTVVVDVEREEIVSATKSEPVVNRMVEVVPKAEPVDEGRALREAVMSGKKNIMTCTGEELAMIKQAEMQGVLK